MSFKVFISHSVAPRELGIVHAMANEAAKRGASPFIPARDWDPEGVIPESVQPHLKDTDYILAIATSSGFQLQWLNREVEEGLKAKKPLLIIADKGIKVLLKTLRVVIDKNNSSGTIKLVSKHLAKFRRDKNAREFLTWIGINGIFSLLFLGTEK